MQRTSEPLTALHARRRSFDATLADLRVQGALIASTPGRMPHFGTCPCCGYPTITREIYDVCAICRWADDGQDDENANDIAGGPNGDYSLTQARHNFVERRSKYRASDPLCELAEESAAERDRLAEAYDSLLPGVDPWAFIGALPRLNALKTALDERRFGKQRVETWRADETHERRQPDREWEIWHSLSTLGAPTIRGRPSPRSPADLRTYRSLQASLSEISDRIESLLGAAAPTVAHRGLWYRCWSSGERAAWVRAFGSRRLGIELEPAIDGRPDALFSAEDDETPEKIARRIAAYFGRNGDAAL